MGEAVAAAPTLAEARHSHPRCPACGRFLAVREQSYPAGADGEVVTEVVICYHTSYDYWNGGYEFTCQ
jgi:C4-type Zn-finger protein